MLYYLLIAWAGLTVAAGAGASDTLDRVREEAERIGETYQGIGTSPGVPDMRIPEATLERVKKLVREREGPSIAIQKRVDQVRDYVNSDTYKRSLNDARAKIYGALEVDHGLGQEKDESAGDQPRIYLFISSSIPMDVLRRYAARMEKVSNATLVMRGFVGGAQAVGPTLRFVADILKEDERCRGRQCSLRRVGVQVDPLLFERYDVAAVPTVVVATGFSYGGSCSEGDPGNASVSDSHKVVGDADIKYAFEQLYAETHDSVFPPLIKSLGGFYYEDGR